MLPAELMGLDYKNFRQLNNLVKNKFFMKALVSNVEATILFLKVKKFNSVVINYDEQSTNLFNCFVICSTIASEPVVTKVNLDIVGSSVGATDNDSILKLLAENNPATLDKAPDSFSNNTLIICLIFYFITS